MYRPYTDGGRAKRDLDIDPKDWLALLTLVEAERKQKAHEQSRRVTNLFQWQRCVFKSDRRVSINGILKIFSLKSDLIWRSLDTNVTNSRKRRALRFWKFRFSTRHYLMIFELTLFSVVVRTVLIEIMDLLLRRTLEFHLRTIEHKNGTYSPLWIVEVELEATKYGLIKTSDKGTPFSVQCLQLRRWQKRIILIANNGVIVSYWSFHGRIEKSSKPSQNN